MNLSQKVAFNTAVQVVSKIITSFFTLLTTIILTGWLGKEGYGNYAYVITLLVLFGSFADWGTTTIGVREAAKEKEKQPEIFFNIFLLKILLSLPAIFLLIFFANFFASRNFLNLSKIIALASFYFLPFAVISFCRVVFQTKLRMEKTALMEILTSFLIFLLSFLGVKFGLNLGYLVGAYLFSAFAGAILGIILVAKLQPLVFSPKRKLLRKLLLESLPMGAILLMFTADNRIDTVMLGGFKGSGAVGIYEVSSRVYDVLILGAAFLMNSLLPIFSSLEKEKLKVAFKKAFLTMLFGAVLVSFFLYFASPLAIKLLTQKRFFEFEDGVGVLRVFSFALFLAYFNHLTGYTIVALGRQRPYFWIALGSLVFNLVANSIFIPRFSYFGAAWVTVATESLVLLITSIFLFLIIFPKTAIRLVNQNRRIFQKKKKILT